MPGTTEEIQNESFSQENRKRYLEETTNSLNALLDDAFGEDQNELRSIFPNECERATINIDGARVSLTFLNGTDESFIEVTIQISFKEAVLGEYHSVYDMNGDLEDESFFFE